MGELMDRSRRVFGTLVKFEVAFPELADVIVEWKEEGQGVRHFGNFQDEKYEYKSSMKEYGGVLRCSNGLCRQGGFELDGVVYDMLRKKETVREDYKICAGSEGSPKLRRVYRKCLNGIKYKITVIYKQ